MAENPNPPTPRPGQESVWDYPRPPRVESSPARVRVILGSVTIADSVATKRVLETSHPPVYYIPLRDIRREYLKASGHRSWCEWKGETHYYSLSLPEKSVGNAAWYFPSPLAGFQDIKNCVAFYPGKVDACYVDEEKVQPQPGDFYGGWITSNIVGPFKGPPGTYGW